MSNQKENCQLSDVELVNRLQCRLREPSLSVYLRMQMQQEEEDVVKLITTVDVRNCEVQNTELWIL
jgi:hypothetical protein